MLVPLRPLLAVVAVLCVYASACIAGAHATSTCDLLRTAAATPVAGATIITSDQNLAGGESITTPLYVTNGATLTIKKGGGTATIIGDITVDGGFIYAEPGADLLWSQTYSGQFQMVMVNNATVGFDTGSITSFNKDIPAFISPILMCDSTTLYLNGANFTTSDPAPFLFENASMIASGGSAELVEVSLQQSASLTYTNDPSGLLSINLYVFLASVSSGSGPVTLPGVTSTSFQFGSTEVQLSSAALFAGGVWVAEGDEGVFQNSPSLLLFVSITSSHSNITDLRPQSYTGSGAATPACVDQACTIQLGFINSTVLLANLYWDGGIGHMVQDSVVGEFSAPSGSGIARRLTVNGAGGTVSIQGGSQVQFIDGVISTTVYVAGTAVFNVQQSSIIQPPSGSNALLISSDSSTLLLSDVNITAPYQLSTSESGAILAADLFDLDAAGSTLTCAGVAFTLSDFLALSLYHGVTPHATVNLTVVWAEVSGGAVPEPYTTAPTLDTTGTRWNSTLAAPCPQSAGTYSLQVAATLATAGSPTLSVARSVVKVVGAGSVMRLSQAASQYALEFDAGDGTLGVRDVSNGKFSKFATMVET